MQDSMNSAFLRISLQIELQSFNLSMAIFLLEILSILLEARFFAPVL